MAAASMPSRQLAILLMYPRRCSAAVGRALTTADAELAGADDRSQDFLTPDYLIPDYLVTTTVVPTPTRS